MLHHKLKKCWNKSLFTGYTKNNLTFITSSAFLVGNFWLSFGSSWKVFSYSTVGCLGPSWNKFKFNVVEKSIFTSTLFDCAKELGETYGYIFTIVIETYCYIFTISLWKLTAISSLSLWKLPPLVDTDPFLTVFKLSETLLMASCQRFWRNSHFIYDMENIKC